MISSTSWPSHDWQPDRIRAVLRTSPATVARRIAALESRLGARLFDRRQSGYVLTESGEAIRLRVQDVEDAVLTVERQAFGRDLRPSGRVRVATTDDIATLVVAPRMADFRNRYPDIALEIVARQDVANLTRRDADVALRLARPTHASYLIRKVGQWNLALYAARSYVEANKLKPGLRDLRRSHLLPGRTKVLISSAAHGSVSTRQHPPWC